MMMISRFGVFILDSFRTLQISHVDYKNMLVSMSQTGVSNDFCVRKSVYHDTTCERSPPFIGTELIDPL